MFSFMVNAFYFLAGIACIALAVFFYLACRFNGDFDFSPKVRAERLLFYAQNVLMA